MTDYSTVLVTTDFSDQALPGVQEAVKLGQRLGSRLILLYVVEDRMPPVLDSKTWATAMAQHRELAQSHLKGYAKEHLVGCDSEIVVVIGRPHEAILEEAERRGADLIVMATHGYGLIGQALLGSTTERVLRQAKCPVLTVRSDKEVG